MLFRHAHIKNSRRHRGWLYSVVFASRISTMVIFFLFLSFLVQPFHKAFASEPIVEAVPEPEAVVADDVLIQEAPPIPEESPPEELTQSDQIQPSVVDTEVPLLLEEDSVSDEVVTSNDETITDMIVAETNADDLSSQDILTNGTSSMQTDESFGVDSIGELELEEVSDLEVPATTTETVIQAQYLVTEENYYQFSKQSCVAVGEGAYHCTRDGKDSVDSQSVVYADIGPSANMEIYLKTKSGDLKQLTDNAYDDTAPFYDAESMRVVWQRLIDGRQQIILYDIKTDKEQQLTFSRSNNMQPKDSIAGSVWQAGDYHDCEIMYFDGNYTDQVTTNDAHDVAPVIKDNYILWSVLGADEQQARVYSLDTKETISIVGHEGGSIENPRFVLVYDTKFDNGDVVTQGFDPLTGLSNPIASTPVEEPVDIPSSDTTGETRALIQNKSSQKDENEFNQIDSNPDPDPNYSSSTDPAVLDLSAGDVVGASSTSPQTDDAFVLTEYDLVLPL